MAGFSVLIAVNESRKEWVPLEEDAYIPIERKPAGFCLSYDSLSGFLISRSGNAAPVEMRSWNFGQSGCSESRGRVA
jgi:hypothetical protein